MRKLSLGLLIALICATGQAAITNWSAGLNASNYTAGVSYNAGQVYLLEVKVGGPTLESMVTYIKNNGLEGSNENVSLLGQSSLNEVTAASGTFWQAMNITITKPSEINTTSTYYALFVDSAGENFVFSDGLISTDSAFGLVPTPSGEAQAMPVFVEGVRGNDSSWSSNGGPIGGEVDPNVPEPTALALLALGVAGVALRRRVR